MLTELGVCMLRNTRERVQWAVWIDAFFAGNSEDPKMLESLTGGAKVEAIFSEVFTEAVYAVEIQEKLDVELSQTLIKNCAGIGGD